MDLIPVVIALGCALCLCTLLSLTLCHLLRRSRRVAVPPSIMQQMTEEVMSDALADPTKELMENELYYEASLPRSKRSTYPSDLVLDGLSAELRDELVRRARANPKCRGLDPFTRVMYSTLKPLTFERWTDRPQPVVPADTFERHVVKRDAFLCFRVPPFAEEPCKAAFREYSKELEMAAVKWILNDGMPFFDDVDEPDFFDDDAECAIYFNLTMRTHVPPSTDNIGALNRLKQIDGDLSAFIFGAMGQWFLKAIEPVDGAATDAVAAKLAGGGGSHVGGSVALAPMPTANGGAAHLGGTGSAQRSAVAAAPVAPAAPVVSVGGGGGLPPTRPAATPTAMRPMPSAASPAPSPQLGQWVSPARPAVAPPPPLPPAFAGGPATLRPFQPPQLPTLSKPFALAPVTPPSMLPTGLRPMPMPTPMPTVGGGRPPMPSPPPSPPSSAAYAVADGGTSGTRGSGQPRPKKRVVLGGEHPPQSNGCANGGGHGRSNGAGGLAGIGAAAAAGGGGGGGVTWRGREAPPECVPPPEAVAVVDVCHMAQYEVRRGYERYGCAAFFDAQRRQVAIWLAADGAMVTPQSGADAWAFAQWHVKCSMVYHGFATKHLAFIHWTVSNTAVVATFETLQPSHPVRRLLWPFIFGAVTINDSAVTKLATPHGGICRIGSQTPESMARYVRALAAQWKYETFEEHLRGVGTFRPGCGLSVDDLPYAHDGRRLWAVLHRFFGRMLALSYRDDATAAPTTAAATAAASGSSLPAVTDDADLVRFWATADVCAFNHEEADPLSFGLPPLSFAALVAYLTHHVFMVCAVHELLGSITLDCTMPRTCSGRILDRHHFARTRPPQATIQDLYRVICTTVATTTLPMPMMVDEIRRMATAHDDAPPGAADACRDCARELDELAAAIDRDNATGARAECPFGAFNPRGLECSCSL